MARYSNSLTADAATVGPVGIDDQGRGVLTVRVVSGSPTIDLKYRIGTETAVTVESYTADAAKTFTGGGEYWLEKNGATGEAYCVISNE